ncbi:MAG: hypothetical protein IJS19_09015, partial [Muribaculaceae bacterium]|nr:hypothetical protein [Muribaculaceae bacterium]
MAQNGFGLANHLAFGNPQSGFGHGHGKIVDLDAVELADFHVDEIVEPQQALASVQGRNHTVFHPPQRQIGLCQE